jgi:hypothetical protein
MTDDAGSYQLAPADLPIEACAVVGHPQDNSATVEEQESLGFAEFMRSSPLVNVSGIVVELIAHDRAHSLRHAPFPLDVSRAGEWNRIAERNNRLEFTLFNRRLNPRRDHQASLEFQLVATMVQRARSVHRLRALL